MYICQFLPKHVWILELIGKVRATVIHDIEHDGAFKA